MMLLMKSMLKILLLLTCDESNSTIILQTIDWIGFVEAGRWCWPQCCCKNRHRCWIKFCVVVNSRWYWLWWYLVVCNEKKKISFCLQTISFLYVRRCRWFSSTIHIIRFAAFFHSTVTKICIVKKKVQFQVVFFFNSFIPAKTDVRKITITIILNFQLSIIFTFFIICDCVRGRLRSIKADNALLAN